MYIPIDQNILIYSALGISVMLLIWVLALQLKLRKLLIGKDIRQLEKIFTEIKADLDTLKQFKTHSEKLHTDFDERLKRSVQGVEAIRFNPFKGTGGGGNQSFALALTDEEKNGVVLSSLYSRDRVSVFAKKIVNGKTQYLAFVPMRLFSAGWQLRLH